MALRKISLKVTPPHKGKRLDQFLADALPAALGEPLSKAKVRMLVVAGAVYLNGKRVRIASKELVLNATVDAYVDLKKIHSDGKSRDVSFEMSADRILFEDEFIIIVNKPPGLPTQPTLDEARMNLFAAVKRFLEKRSGASQVYLGLHHRLDRDTSGVILFTKDTRANAGVADLFALHKAQKTYQALTSVPMSANERATGTEWTIKNFLGKLPSPGKRAKFGAVHSGGDAAETHFKVLESHSKGAWIEATPKTGRTHQIRVHLSEDGLPISGDDLYGRISPPNTPGVPRLMLHAVRLTFPHPVHQTLMSIQSPLPEDFLRCLEALRLS